MNSISTLPGLASRAGNDRQTSATGNELAMETEEEYLMLEEVKSWVGGSADKLSALASWIAYAETLPPASVDAITRNGEAKGVELYIEQRWNSADWAPWLPCVLTSTGNGSYVFRNYDGTLSGQRNNMQAKVAEEEDDAVMEAVDLVEEWPEYHRAPRLDPLRLALKKLSAPSATATALGTAEKAKPIAPSPAPPPRTHVDERVSTTLTVGAKGVEVILTVAEPRTEPDEWTDFSIGTRAILNDCSGVVWLLGGDTMIGFCYDDVTKPWLSLERDYFLKHAVTEAHRGDDAIMSVLKGPVPNAPTTRTPAAYLYGRLLERSDRRWEAYTRYRPIACPSGKETECSQYYGEANNPHELKAGCCVSCAPPMVSCGKGANSAPTATSQGILLFIMLGHVENSTKGTSECRRYCVVRFPNTKSDCWVLLKNVGLLEPGAVTLSSPPDLSATALQPLALAAAAARLPSTVQGHTKDARVRQKRGSVASESGAEGGGEKQGAGSESSPKRTRRATRNEPTADAARAPAPAPAMAPAPTPADTPAKLNELGRKEGRWGVATLDAMELRELESVSYLP